MSCWCRWALFRQYVEDIETNMKALHAAEPVNYKQWVWVSSFLTAHQHILGYLVPYNDVEGTVKEVRYSQLQAAYQWRLLRFDNVRVLLCRYPQILSTLQRYGCQTDTTGHCTVCVVNLAGQNCAICMNSIKTHQVVKRLPCSHTFHHPCCYQWLLLVCIELRDW